MVSRHDIVIVGAGIAGSSSAIALAPEGYRILLLDQALFPRDKPCGEGIMPQGVQILAELGLLPEILAHGGAKVRGMRYWNRQGVLAQADFPPSPVGPSFGIVMRRYHLDNLLLERAASFTNVTVRQGFRVTDVVQEDGDVKGVGGHAVDSPNQREVFHAPLTIGTDGRHSVFHATCGLTKTVLRRKRFGVTGHLQGVEGTGSYVEVLPCPDGEIYVAPCAEGITLVAILLEARAMRFFKGDLAARYASFLRDVKGFRERITKSELVPPVAAVGPLGFTIEPCYRPGLLLIGDSAGFLDPITGEGMTLALKSLKAALPLIKEAFAVGSFDAALGRRYAQDRLQVIEDVFRFTQLLLNLSQYRFIADRAVRRLSHDQLLLQKLLGVVTGSHRYGDISLRDKAALLMG
ncbi:MAG: NAD(P)/FAD-dependent oxidoreductase [Gemmatimonadetes bacterium]|nr:NAD(P)/FAD-dependent oxidoreductase [Gemmatimonadota bacterium]